jgi:uncharacterized BrkB/YihY/UPF0761 family membrane protein
MTSATFSPLVELIMGDANMSYEVAIGPWLALVFAIIGLMSIIYWIAPPRARELIMGVIVAGMTIELIIILPIWLIRI